MYTFVKSGSSTYIAVKTISSCIARRRGGEQIVTRNIEQPIRAIKIFFIRMMCRKPLSAP